MISLKKKPIPNILASNVKTWTDILLAHERNKTEPTLTEKSHYRHPHIKSVLVTETDGKCAYCESKLQHISYGDVEHIVPKSKKTEKTFEWSNLTLACDICNTNKSNHFGNHDDLVDPYCVEPSDHFNFVGATVLPKPGSGPGMATETTIKLNRPELVERRTEKLLSLNKILQLLVEVNDAGKRAIIRRDLELNEQLSEKEYCAMSRVFIRQQLIEIDQ